MTEKKSRHKKDDYRAGFVTFLGRPNTGKSTLMNALIGEKVAIVSDKPQTTRRAIRGIIHKPNFQVIIIDTPGIHRPRTLLGERLNDMTESVLSEVDILGVCLPADEEIGPGDKRIIENLVKYPKTKKIGILTKIDRVSRAEVAARLLEISALFDWDAVIPTAFNDEEQLAELSELLGSLMPRSEALYPEGMITEDSREIRIAEIIRECALDSAREELPHSIAVTVSDIFPAEANRLTRVFAEIWVERDSQKGIIIGKRGSNLARIGSESRAEIKRVLGEDVYLDLQVKLAKDWQKDPKLLMRLGF
ncbi:MAG: GTPase Era [Microbacteriaceae bacterium]|nr:GTPase Era [Microbacteriaceae bacterium]